MPVNLALYAGTLHSADHTFSKKSHSRERIKSLALQPMQPWWNLTENIPSLLLFWSKWTILIAYQLWANIETTTHRQKKSAFLFAVVDYGKGLRKGIQSVLIARLCNKYFSLLTDESLFALRSPIAPGWKHRGGFSMLCLFTNGKQLTGINQCISECVCQTQGTQVFCCVA